MSTTSDRHEMGRAYNRYRAEGKTGADAADLVNRDFGTKLDPGTIRSYASVVKKLDGLSAQTAPPDTSAHNGENVITGQDGMNASQYSEQSPEPLTGHNVENIPTSEEPPTEEPAGHNIMNRYEDAPEESVPPESSQCSQHYEQPGAGESAHNVPNIPTVPNIPNIMIDRDTIESLIRRIAQEVYDMNVHNIAQPVELGEDMPPEPVTTGRKQNRSYKRVTATIDSNLWDAFLQEQQRLNITSTGRMMDVLLWRALGRPKLSYETDD